ncbi:MAG: hypothetical protein ACRD8W_03390 [Nitrososphaeraceae archaeon]
MNYNIPSYICFHGSDIVVLYNEKNVVITSNNAYGIRKRETANHADSKEPNKWAVVGRHTGRRGRECRAREVGYGQVHNTGKRSYLNGGITVKR